MREHHVNMKGFWEIIWLSFGEKTLHLNLDAAGNVPGLTEECFCLKWPFRSSVQTFLYQMLYMESLDSSELLKKHNNQTIRTRYMNPFLSPVVSERTMLSRVTLNWTRCDFMTLNKLQLLESPSAERCNLRRCILHGVYSLVQAKN